MVDSPRATKAPLRGLAFQLYRLFVHPVTQGVVMVACGGILYYNSKVLGPLRTAKDQAVQESNQLLMEKARLQKLMPAVRLQDLEIQANSFKPRLVLNDAAAMALADETAKILKETRWEGEVTPKPKSNPFRLLPEFSVYPVEVILRSRPEASAKMEAKDQTRLFDFMRKMAKVDRLHILRSLVVEADAKKGWEVRLEYDFFSAGK